MTHWADRGSSLGLYRICCPSGPLTWSSGVSLTPSRLPSGPIHSLEGASWSALSSCSWLGLTFSAALTAPEAKTSRPMMPRSETIFRASLLVMKRVTRVRRWAAAAGGQLMLLSCCDAVKEEGNIPWSTSFLASSLVMGATPSCLARDGSPAYEV